MYFLEATCRSATEAAASTSLVLVMEIKFPIPSEIPYVTAAAASDNFGSVNQ